MADPTQKQTWLIVGASRGIGLEFCRQLIDLGHRVIGTVRNANAPWDIKDGKGEAVRLVCDVSAEESITVSRRFYATSFAAPP